MNKRNRSIWLGLLNAASIPNFAEQSLAAPPGLEPGIIDPESIVLPITPQGNIYLSGAVFFTHT